VKTVYLLFTVLIFLGCSEQNKEQLSKKKEIVLERNYNEVFEYELVPGVGSHTTKKSGDTANLLMEYPYLFMPGSNIIPSELIINEILSKGKVDAGMSGGLTWEPYTLKKDEFESLIDELNKISKYGKLEYKEPDSWVKTFEDWGIWIFYIQKGIPWEEHKRLNDIVVALEKEQRIAKEQNDFDKVNELHIKLMKPSNDLRDFFMEHL
jgi:hypothetical protein